MRPNADYVYGAMIWLAVVIIIVALVVWGLTK